MAKVCISHFIEAQILEAIGMDYIDESEIFTLPFVCGCRNLSEVAAMTPDRGGSRYRKHRRGRSTRAAWRLARTLMMQLG
ncbi:hypothetical protein ACFX12_030524 [Malus domestica]